MLVGCGSSGNSVALTAQALLCLKSHISRELWFLYGGAKKTDETLLCLWLILIAKRLGGNMCSVTTSHKSSLLSRCGENFFQSAIIQTSTGLLQNHLLRQTTQHRSINRITIGCHGDDGEGNERNLGYDGC